MSYQGKERLEEPKESEPRSSNVVPTQSTANTTQLISAQQNSPSIQAEKRFCNRTNVAIPPASSPSQPMCSDLENGQYVHPTEEQYKQHDPSDSREVHGYAPVVCEGNSTIDAPHNSNENAHRLPTANSTQVLPIEENVQLKYQEENVAKEHFLLSMREKYLTNQSKRASNATASPSNPISNEEDIRSQRIKEIVGQLYKESMIFNINSDVPLPTTSSQSVPISAQETRVDERPSSRMNENSKRFEPTNASDTSNTSLPSTTNSIQSNSVQYKNCLSQEKEYSFIPNLVHVRKVTEFISIVSGSSRIKFVCDICNESHFRDVGHVREHQLRNHDIPYPFPCHICKKNYISKPGLRDHLRKIHHTAFIS